MINSIAERQIYRRFFNQENYQKIRQQLISFLEKFLIRTRIIVLRIDRTVFKNLTKIKRRKNNEDLKVEEENSIISFREENTEEKLIEDNIDKTHILDIKAEEERLLKELRNNSKNIDVLKNLARIYFCKEDFSSACWVLLRAYRLDKKDNVVQDLLIELYEKRGRKEWKKLK